MTIVSLIAVASAFLPSIQSGHRAAPAACSRPAVASRARAPVAFVEQDGDDVASDIHQASAPATLFTKTESGLSLKDLAQGDGEAIPTDALVSIRFTATLLSTGEVIQRTGSRPLTFQRGRRLDMFDEAIDGMRSTGSKRRVLIRPESKYSALGELGETVDFEIEVVEVVTGGKKALYRARGAVNGVVNLLFWYYVCQFVLELTGVLPSGGQPPVVDGQVVDAANAWAAAGLAQVGL